jgi:3-isopropylmalate/(R)-2-methylmalate dehydratase small subunit
MTLPKIVQVVGRAIPVLGDDIDTDRIIPARFMKCLTFDGLGEYLFYDTRFDEDGSEKSHNLNLPCFRDASIMVSGFRLR